MPYCLDAIASLLFGMEKLSVVVGKYNSTEVAILLHPEATRQ